MMNGNNLARMSRSLSIFFWGGALKKGLKMTGMLGGGHTTGNIMNTVYHTQMTQ